MRRELTPRDNVPCAIESRLAVGRIEFFTKSDMSRGEAFVLRQCQISSVF